MNVFRIASIEIAIDFNFTNKNWSEFNIVDDATNIVSCITTLYKIHRKYGISECEIPDKVYKCYFIDKDVMFIDELWTSARIVENCKQTSLEGFTNQIFYTHAVQRRMIQIHSSMINYQDKGLLFLGPSGIGKTTMAELWNKYRNALIINGDMNFVQETDECFIGWGTPWHGSSPYCENTSVPVKALIVLKQAPENSIRELKNFEKVQLVSNNIIYPTWLENGMELCLETLDHLLSALPVYELSCRPDEDAVRLTEEAVLGGGV